MDHELLQELINIENDGNTSAAIISPDRATTSFFDSLPQPGYDSVPSLTITSTTSTSFDRGSHLLQKGSSSTDTLGSSNSTISTSTSKSIPRPNLSKRNTCGTMYVASTMADPDKDALIKVSLHQSLDVCVYVCVCFN